MRFVQSAIREILQSPKFRSVGPGALWAVLGSRLLLSYRAPAGLKSGSPPGVASLLRLRRCGLLSWVVFLGILLDTQELDFKDQRRTWRNIVAFALISIG